MDENLAYLPVGASLSTTPGYPIVDKIDTDRLMFRCAHECLQSTDCHAFDVMATPRSASTCRLHDLAALDARSDQYLIQGSCDVSWFESDGHCFKLSPRTSNWADAEAVCVAQKGHLVTIRSARENAFVASLTLAFGRQLDLIWIGGRMTGGAQRWSSGEQWGFENFGFEEPNTADGCMAMYRFQWFDVSCELQYQFMCKKRA
ncbi:snaclec coagulation factor IX/factor X-binding protein subunit A-like [Mya arenaria]|uniref:snaclec coagulation factor IX/factor X-binding protein subunit A-like n=1 Tax=Mya arenaria TaxID=6604 RepID=UPI0022E76489|nr:snaclec coagulation factor IX/factor X-binding protein subunit A-like [Mya arenaria]